MGWCSEHGLPHSALLDWDPEDRAKLVAYLLEQSSKCQSCGTAEWEWEEDRYAYEAAVHQCWGCYVKEFSREDAEGMLGARITLVPKDIAARQRDMPKSRQGVGRR